MLPPSRNLNLFAFVDVLHRCNGCKDMLTRFSWFFLVIALISLPSVAADKNEVAIQAFRDAGAGSYIDASYGYAVFPSIGKAGLLVGGARQGRGLP